MINLRQAKQAFDKDVLGRGDYACWKRNVIKMLHAKTYDELDFHRNQAEYYRYGLFMYYNGAANWDMTNKCIKLIGIQSVAWAKRFEELRKIDAYILGRYGDKD